MLFWFLTEEAYSHGGLQTSGVRPNRVCVVLIHFNVGFLWEFNDCRIIVIYIICLHTIFVPTDTFPSSSKVQILCVLCLLGRLGVRQLRQTAAFKRTKELFSSFGTCRIYDNVRLTCQQVPLSDKLFLVYILETLYLLVVAQR